MSRFTDKVILMIQEYAARLRERFEDEEAPAGRSQTQHLAPQDPHDISQLGDSETSRKSRFVQSVQKKRESQPQRQKFDTAPRDRPAPRNPSAAETRGRQDPVNKTHTTPAQGQKWQTNLNPNPEFSSSEARGTARQKGASSTDIGPQGRVGPQDPDRSRSGQSKSERNPGSSLDKQSPKPWETKWQASKKPGQQSTRPEKSWSRITDGEKTWSGLPPRTKKFPSSPPEQQQQQYSRPSSQQDFRSQSAQTRNRDTYDSYSRNQERDQPRGRRPPILGRPGEDSLSSNGSSPRNRAITEYGSRAPQQAPSQARNSRPRQQERQQGDELEFNDTATQKSYSVTRTAGPPLRVVEYGRGFDDHLDDYSQQRSTRQNLPPSAGHGRQREIERVKIASHDHLDNRLVQRLEEGKGKDQDLEDWEREGSEAEELDAHVSIPPPIVREQSGATATFFTNESFEDLGLSERLRTSLASIGVNRPSHIQAAAIKALQVDFPHAILADHSGSGKTLAYLIPLIEQLKKLEHLKGSRMGSVAAPPILIVVPTQELCAQVFEVAKAISRGGCKFQSMAATGGHKKQSQKQNLQSGVDVLVGTPGRLLTLLNAGELSLEQCLYIVIDEVDVLAASMTEFGSEIALFQKAASARTKFVLVTASIPEPTWMDLQGQFPGVRPVLGPGLHRPAPGSLEQLVDCSGGGIINESTGYARKIAGLMSLLKEQPVAKTIIFCNKIETCRKVENSFRRTKELAAFTVLPHHAAIDETERTKHLKRLLGASPKYAEFDKDAKLVLLTTDRASRGLDTTLVDHVILFDFPRSPSEYVRRAGRTARGAGSKGVVSLIVIGRQVGLAKKILERNEKGIPLHKVPVG